MGGNLPPDENGVIKCKIENSKCKMMGCKIFVVWATCDDVGDDAHIVPKNYDKYRKTVGATLCGRPIFPPHPGFTFGKTHLPLTGKACRGGNLPPDESGVIECKMQNVK